MSGKWGFWKKVNLATKASRIWLLVCSFNSKIHLIMQYLREVKMQNTYGMNMRVWHWKSTIIRDGSENVIQWNLFELVGICMLIFSGLMHMMMYRVQVLWLNYVQYYVRNIGMIMNPDFMRKRSNDCFTSNWNLLFYVKQVKFITKRATIWKVIQYIFKLWNTPELRHLWSPGELTFTHIICPRLAYRQTQV